MAILGSKLHEFVMVDFVLVLRVEEREQNFYRKECQKTKKQPGNYVIESLNGNRIGIKNFFKTFCTRLKNYLDLRFILTMPRSLCNFSQTLIGYQQLQIRNPHRLTRISLKLQLVLRHKPNGQTILKIVFFHNVP